MSDAPPATRPPSLQYVVRQFCLPGGECSRPLSAQTRAANLSTDLALSDWQRVQLCRRFEDAFDVKVNEALVWLRKTTLGDIYDDVARCLKERGESIPETSSEDDTLHNELTAMLARLRPRVALLFAGQGAQRVGMAVHAYEDYASVRQLFKRASALLDYDLFALCRDGPADRLAETRVCQPAMFVADLAALEVLRANHPSVIDQSVACAGLSLGEYAALVFADAMSFDDALRVVHVRAEAMQSAAERNTTGMASVLGLSDDVVERLLNDCNDQTDSDNERVTISNYLAPGNRVVGGIVGTLALVAALGTQAPYNAKKVASLNVSGAFHTQHMKSACAALKEALDQVEIRMPRLSVISNVTGKPYESVDEIRSSLVRHIVEPVRWQQSIETLLDDERVVSFYELGSGTVLTGLMRHILRARDDVGIEVKQITV